MFQPVRPVANPNVVYQCCTIVVKVVMIWSWSLTWPNEIGLAYFIDITCDDLKYVGPGVWAPLQGFNIKYSWYCSIAWSVDCIHCHCGVVILGCLFDMEHICWVVFVACGLLPTLQIDVAYLCWDYLEYHCRMIRCQDCIIVVWYVDIFVVRYQRLVHRLM